MLPQSVGGWSALLGWATAVVGPIFVFLTTRRKTDVDESAVILGKWKELVEAHETAIKRLTEDFARERTRWQSENDRLQHRVTELETENARLKDDITGLKRAIAQNSQSAAFQLGGFGRGNSDAFPEGTKE